ncbi:GDSL-type esterase/lipase family protein [Streptomyces sp. 12297]
MPTPRSRSGPIRPRARTVTQLVCLLMLATSLVVLRPDRAHAALPEPTLNAITFNMQGGTRWGTVRDSLIKNADLVALQEATTPPGDYTQSQSILSNNGDQTTTATGLPSLKYQLYKNGWGKPGREEGVQQGELYYLNILDKDKWGQPGGPGGGDVDPDAMVNAQKSMAIWVRTPLTNPEIKIITPQGDNKKWIRSRPAFGLKVDGVWYFNIHAASIRTDDALNAHSAALVAAIDHEMAGQPWRALGDFNNVATTTIPVFPPYYAKVDGNPFGAPSPTQYSKGASLDYMLSKQPMANLAVSTSSNNGGSDHYPVRFAHANSPTCGWGWSDTPTVYSPRAGTPVASRAAAAATGSDADACGMTPAVVSMGDSYISGEAGRWAGNANSRAEGSAWGTDRSAVECNADESTCKHDLARVYGDTSYEQKPGAACDRSDSAEIQGVELGALTGAQRYNISCSGATTANVLSEPFKGQRPQIEELRDIAARHEVGLVVLSVGGNDLRFSEILADCAKAYLYPSFNNKGCIAAQEETFAGALGTVGANVVKSLEAIRATLRAAGQEDDSYHIVLQSYPNPLPKGDENRYPENSSNPFQKYGRYWQGGCPFLDKDSDWAHDSVIPRISTMLAGAAERAQVSFLDLQNAFTGHELCAKTAQQADTSHTTARPLDAARAEWVRWVPYLSEETKDIGWTAQGNQQEAVHPNHYGQQALAACLTKMVGALDAFPVTSRCTGRTGVPPDSLDDTSQLLARGNRRGPVEGLPDWSRAGYHGGERLPSSSARSQDPRCRITPGALASQYGVRPDDGQDDTAGIQRAIDHIRTDCTPQASRSRLSSIELPRGTVDVSKQLSVDASYLVIRGQGAGFGSGTRIVFRPDAATRYDTLYKGSNEPTPSRWDQDAMVHECPARLGGGIRGKGGWMWPGRGLFRVQTREVSAKHLRMCGPMSGVPENRRDIFEGSINQHWESGVEVAGIAADPLYAARRGDRTIQLKSTADMPQFRPGNDLWVGAANSLKFYELQQVDTAKSPLEDLHMRQQVFTISAVDAAQRTVTIDRPLEFDVPVNSVSDGSPPLTPGAPPYASKVTPLRMITDVGFEDFAFTQQLDQMPKLGGGTYQVSGDCATGAASCPTHNYGNLAPEYAMHGIVFKWAADSWVRGVHGEMTGSHPIVTEVAKNLQIEHNRFDGAWNKGKGGNGYLRGSRVWDSLYAFNTTRNLRHFTFQWSASNNVVIGNDFDSDLNLHGGWERRNLFENNAVRVPFEHRSGSCSANCGGEGGASDLGTWWPIYWAAGNKAVKWSGSSGPQNVFFHNTLAKQTKAGGAYEDYKPYSRSHKVFQFGSDAGDASRFTHLTQFGTAIFDWADMENHDYTGGLGVNDSLSNGTDSLFLKFLPESRQPR